MTLPAELGGRGADLMDLVLTQERLAQGDAPTAVAVNMHVFNTGLRSHLWRLGDTKALPLLEACAGDPLIICSGTSDPRMNTAIGFAGLVSWFTTSLPACYRGLAEAARDYVIGWARERGQPPSDRQVTHYPGNRFLAAEMDVGIKAARVMLLQTASALSEPASPANRPLADLLACQHFVTETAVSIADKAMRIAAGAALSRSAPLEQMYRDVRCDPPAGRI